MRMLYQKVILASVIGFGLSGCMAEVPIAPRSALQIREIQTREYPSEPRMVMKTLLNVLQDQGFITRNAVPELGLITATKEIDRENSSSRFFHILAGGDGAVWEKMEVMEATINVSEFGTESRVRVSFQKKILDNRGGVMQVEEVSDPAIYQEFLSRVDQGLFIQKERI